MYYAVPGNEYDNANSDNDFLRSLAEGGIQVGALARHYYKTKYRSFGYHYIETKDKSDALRQTAEAMAQENVVIAEAAFEWEGCFVRADILVKSGETVQLIRDITLTETLVIPADKNISLNLNGKTLAHEDAVNSYAINNHGTLTIKGNGIVNARGIYNGYGNGFLHRKVLVIS